MLDKVDEYKRADASRSSPLLAPDNQADNVNVLLSTAHHAIEHLHLSSTYQPSTTQNELTPTPHDEPTHSTAASPSALVLAHDSDEFEYLVRYVARHSPPSMLSTLECVCRPWREAIYKMRFLSHERSLYPANPYPAPKIPAGLTSPSAVVALPPSELCIADTANDLVRFVDAESGALRLVLGAERQIRLAGIPAHAERALVRLCSPMGLAVHGDYVYIADTFQHRVIKVRPADGAQVAEAGSHGELAGQFLFPQGMVVHRGLLYVCDSGNDRLQVLGAGNLAPRALFRGSTDAPLRRPRAIAVHDERLYVSEYERFRIVVLSMAGELLRTIGGRHTPLGRLHSAFGVAIFCGRLVVAEGANCDGRPAGDGAETLAWERSQRRMRVLTLEGAPLQMLRPVSSDVMLVDPRALHACGDFLYLADSAGHTIHRFSYVGRAR